MSARLCVLLAALAAAAAVSAQPADGPAGALARYVAKPDASFAWREYARYEQGGAEILELRLVSQTWRDIVWKHKLYIIKPARLISDRHGLLVISGGRWRDRYDTEPPPDSLERDAKRFVRVAKRLGTVIAVLEQVPFQPMLDLTEDRLIAYTFDQYAKTGDPEWPLLLPMVKSAVRAMDAVEQSAAEDWGLTLTTFTVAGASKRGWTSWLTAAADARVTAVAPIVIDALNFEAHFPHQLQMWGGYSEQMRPYTDIGLPDLLQTDTGRALAAIVDPYSYRAMLEMPKLIAIATNDRFFPVDSLNLYWDGLVGPKYIRYFPNNGHGLSDFRGLVRSLDALNRTAAEAPGTELAELDWEYVRGAAQVRLCVDADERPSKVRLWAATSPTRDFREAEWGAERVRASNGVFVIDRPRPAAGYAAIFAELQFGHGRQKYSLSTTLDLLAAEGTPDPLPLAPGREDVCPIDLANGNDRLNP